MLFIMMPLAIHQGILALGVRAVLGSASRRLVAGVVAIVLAWLVPGVQAGRGACRSRRQAERSHLSRCLHPFWAFPRGGSRAPIVRGPPPGAARARPAASV